MLGLWQAELMGRVGKLIGDQVGGLVLEEGGGGHIVVSSKPKVGEHTTSTRHEHEHDERQQLQWLHQQGNVVGESVDEQRRDEREYDARLG